ncbi:MAG: DUF6382 domain-containing protein [Lachnospiraceae bacterium]
MNAEYIYSFNRNYLKWKVSVKEGHKMRYQYQILTSRKLDGLLSADMYATDGEYALYYEISNMQSLEKWFTKEKIDKKWMERIAEGLKTALWSLEQYLLDGRNLLTEPAHIFVNMESEKIYFVYFPYYIEEKQQDMEKFLTFLIENTDETEKDIIETVYDIYAKWESRKEQFNWETFLTLWEKHTECEEEKESLEVVHEGLETGIFSSGNENRESRGRENQNRGNHNRENQNRGNQNRENQNRGNQNRQNQNRENQNRENKSREGEKPEKQKELPGKREIADFLFGRHKAVNRNPYRECVAMENWEYEAGEEKQEEKLEERQEEKQEERKLYGNGKQNRRVLRLDTLPAVVGKKEDVADIVLQDASIGIMHARFTEENGQVYLEDLNTEQGTYKNSVRLKPYEKVEILREDEIKLGKLEFTYR